MLELQLVVGWVLVTSTACSLFEAVLYSVPATHVEMLAQSGRPSGRTLKRMRQKIDRPISAILSLNTIANTGGGAVAGALAASALGEGNVIYFSVAFTLAILLLSEVLPKTIGVVYSRQLASAIAQPLNLLVIVFRPLIALTQLATNLVWKGTPRAACIGRRPADAGRVWGCALGRSSSTRPVSSRMCCRWRPERPGRS